MRIGNYETMDLTWLSDVVGHLETARGSKDLDTAIASAERVTNACRKDPRLLPILGTSQEELAQFERKKRVIKEKKLIEQLRASAPTSDLGEQVLLLCRAIGYGELRISDLNITETELHRLRMRHSMVGCQAMDYLIVARKNGDSKAAEHALERLLHINLEPEDIGSSYAEFEALMA